MTLNYGLMILELVQYLCGAALFVGVCVELWRHAHGDNPYERATRELELKLAPKPKPETETKNETS